MTSQTNPKTSNAPADVADEQLDEVSGGPIYVKVDGITPPSIRDGTSHISDGTSNIKDGTSHIVR